MTAQIIASFQKTRPWVLFLSILGYIGAGLTFICALIVPIAAFAQGKAESIAAGVGLFIVYSVSGVFCYLIPSVLLGRYASRIRNFLAAANDMASLEAAIGAQKSFWRYVGILALIGLCIGVICLVVALIGVVLLTARR